MVTLLHSLAGSSSNVSGVTSSGYAFESCLASTANKQVPTVALATGLPSSFMEVRTLIRLAAVAAPSGMPAM